MYGYAEVNISPNTDLTILKLTVNNIDYSLNYVGDNKYNVIFGNNTLDIGTQYKVILSVQNSKMQSYGDVIQQLALLPTMQMPISLFDDGSQVSVSIGEMAFRSKKKLKKVMLPTTLKRIEKDAFYDCDDLDNVVLPYSVTSVKGYAFAECDSLRNITFTSLPAQLAKHAFSDSDNLQKIYVPKGTYKKFIKFLNLNGDENFLIQETEETGENQTRQDMPSISVAEKVEENNETTDGGNETEE